MNSAIVLDSLQKRLGSADWSKWQIHRWPFYDYIRYPAAGTNELTFFSTPLGGVDANSSLSKTLEQTNLPKSRAFGQVYYFIHQIRTHIHILPHGRQASGISSDANVISSTYGDMMDALHNLMNQGVLNIKIGSKDYFDIPKPFVMCPPGFGANIIQHAQGDTLSDSLWCQQSSNAADVYHLTPPQMIEPEQVVEVTIAFDNANSPALTNLVNSTTPRVDIGVIFDGYIARPAQ